MYTLRVCVVGRNEHSLRSSFDRNIQERGDCDSQAC